MALPQQLGRYTLERRLAAGGMAEIFLAKQSGPEGFEKVCVVKRMLPHLNEDEVFVAMFLDEARLAARLSHPNLAQIFDFGHDHVEDAYFLAMEYVPGANLHRIIDDHARRHQLLPIDAAVKIVALACAGLDFAHKATDGDGAPLHIIHRDISPHNIMLSKNGDVKVIDFGIAKANVGRHATKAGTLKGKYAYMAPEQLRGQPVDLRTDIYAMGLVLYELLAGQTAIQGDSEAKLMEAAARRLITPLETLRADVPAKIRAAVERATAMNVAERYGSAAELADELEDFLVASGTRIRSTELAALLTASTSTTNVTPGTPSSPRPFLATPASKADLAVDRSKLSDSKAEKPPQPAARDNDDDEVTVPTAPPTRRFPAAVAVGLLVLAAAATAVAVSQNRGRAPDADSALLVPPPPQRPVVPEAEQTPPPPPPAAPSPAPAPTPAELARPAAAKRPPSNAAPRSARAPAASAAQAKSTVVFRVLPYAEVFRDGQSIGVTPLKPLELEPGKYSFKFVCSDTKKSDAREVTIAAGAQSVLKVDLR